STGDLLLERFVWRQEEVRKVCCGPGGRAATSGEGTVLLWDLRPPRQRLPRGGARALYAALGAGGQKAYRAGWALADHPAEAIRLLEKEFRPAPRRSVDGKAVDRWLADLDSPQVPPREAASKALAMLGRA